MEVGWTTGSSPKELGISTHAEYKEKLYTSSGQPE